MLQHAAAKLCSAERLFQAALKGIGPCTAAQAYRNFGWGKGRFQFWCNPNDGGATFSDSGYRLACVLWLHYVSKVAFRDGTALMAAC